jgi:hypothetical protein
MYIHAKRVHEKRISSRVAFPSPLHRPFAEDSIYVIETTPVVR